VTTLDIAAPVLAPAAAKGPSRRQLLVKSAMDRVVAAVGLVVLLPALLLVGVLVRVTTPGPAIYRQVRYGRDGRSFRMWKFRTMTQDADGWVPSHNDADGLLFKLRADPRVTRLGSVLRRWSLDELPQLVNVIRGEMSLVGPRPLPVHPALYEPHALGRLAVRPGVTGLWQISGRSEVSWQECVQLDLDYVATWSIALDIRILLRTFRAVVRRAGAY
jgi:lipopolysaccharide/colanic/teichoic acid biosynthesis glycosyltransferase